MGHLDREATHNLYTFSNNLRSISTTPNWNQVNQCVLYSVNRRFLDTIHHRPEETAVLDQLGTKGVVHTVWVVGAKVD